MCYYIYIKTTTNKDYAMKTLPPKIKITALQELMLGGDYTPIIQNVEVTGIERVTDFKPFGQYNAAGERETRLVIFNSLFVDTDITLAFGDDYRIWMEASYGFEPYAGLERNPNTVEEFINFIETTTPTLSFRTADAENSIHIQVYNKETADAIKGITGREFETIGYSGDMVECFKMNDWTAESAVTMLEKRLNSAVDFPELREELIEKVKAAATALLKSPALES